MKSAFRYILFVIAFPALLIYKNPGDVQVWFFWKEKLPAAGLILFIFLPGLIAGILLASSFNRKQVLPPRDDAEDEDEDDYPPRSRLSQEDRDYIS